MTGNARVEKWVVAVEVPKRDGMAKPKRKQLFHLFQEYTGAAIKKAWVQKPTAAGQDCYPPPLNRGFGFVVFEDKQMVDLLIKPDAGTFVPLSDGRQLEVKRALSAATGRETNVHPIHRLRALRTLRKGVVRHDVAVPLKRGQHRGELAGWKPKDGDPRVQSTHVGATSGW